MRPLTETVTISSIESATVRGGFTRYTILAERGESVGRLDHWLSLTTLNDLRAAACERAKATDTPVTVTYRDTGYFDRDLVAVEFPEQAVAS